MKKYYCRGLCRSCYSLAKYHRKKHDPAWYARVLANQTAARARRRELQALADLARVTQALEDML